MKEKSKTGLFGFFQRIKNSQEIPEEPLPLSTPLAEIDENTPEEIAAADSDDSVQSDSNKEDLPPSSFSIWEKEEDPLLVRIDEEALYLEYLQFVEKMDSLYEVFNRKNSLSYDPNPQPKDAQPQLYISKDRMAAWIYVIPPLNGGQDITDLELKAALAQERVTTGILEETLQEIVETPIYRRAMLIAKGTLARNGIDGTIKDHYERILKPEFKEDEKGTIDFRNLNMIQSVKEGETICEITPAVPGENGMTVTGQPSPYTIKGIDVKVPSGHNTILNQDHTLLISQKTGHVTYANGRFQVDPVLKIDGNIDGNIGNLDYDGNIMISGDVKNGFSVKASGSIDIRGSVEGAKITAKGPITISNGVLGNGQGVLTSGSHVKCSYLEHCTVVAGGNVYANSIINSKVECNQDIIATSGTGIIVGGSLLAAGTIKAHVIGSKLNCITTELTIADIPQYVEEANNLTKEMDQLKRQKSEVKKNLIYLETSERKDKKELLEKFYLAEESLSIREQGIISRLKEITANTKTQTGFIKCRQMFPTARIRIGSSCLAVQEERSNPLIYQNKEGEIIIGNG